MKLIIAGGRDINLEPHEILNAIADTDLVLAEITEIVSGGASGADKSGEVMASIVGIDIKRFPAKWDEYGKIAGPIRNKQMADYADALLLFWDGKSRGSADMKKQMQDVDKPIYEVIIDGANSTSS